MGLFSRKFKQPVQGSATVAASTACPSHASVASCRMNLVVSVPGMPATAVEHTEMVRADKWPFPGMVLPIEVDAAKPSRMRIRWADLPSGQQRARDAAAQWAANMNQPAGGHPAGFTPTTPGHRAADAPRPGLTAADMVTEFFQGAGPATTATTAAGFRLPPGARIVSSTISINGAPASPDGIAAIETLTGMDLDGDGIVGPPPTPPQPGR